MDGCIKYIITNLFLASLERGYATGSFATNNAYWLKTPNNSFDSNLNALKTLAQRLDEIQTMKTDSFEYQTAIQQITAQEQGEATALISSFEGCYFLACYPIAWEWIGFAIVLSGIISIVAGFFTFMANW